MTVPFKARCKHFLKARGRLLIVFAVCFGLTGTALYAKKRIDAALASHQEASAGTNLLDTTPVARSGFWNFLDSTRLYMHKMDRGSLEAMRRTYEETRDTARQAGQSAPQGIRHDIDAILNVYNDVLVRAETNGDATTSGLSSTDLVLMSNAAEALEERVRFLTPSAKQGPVAAPADRWSLALTFVAWASAMIAVLATFAASSKSRAPDQGVGTLAQILPPLQQEHLSTAPRTADFTEHQMVQAMALVLRSEQALREAAEQNTQTAAMFARQRELAAERLTAVLNSERRPAGEETADRDPMALERLASDVGFVKERLATLLDLAYANNSRLGETIGNVHGSVNRIQTQLQQQALMTETRLDEMHRAVQSTLSSGGVLERGGAGRGGSDQMRTILDAIHTLNAQASRQEENRYEKLAGIILRQKEEIETAINALNRRLAHAAPLITRNDQSSQIEEKQNLILGEVIKTLEALNDRVVELDRAVGIDLRRAARG